ncbi:MAG: hypothetical protein H7Y38_10285, partial [Armatimonadetes bacterium]|nr:hypothetical protein [Armatimonadota bacterium]
MRNLFPLAATVAATLLFPPCAAFAQTAHNFRLPVYTRGSLTAGGRVWTVGSPEMIAASNVVGVSPSRDYKHLLIVRQTRTLTPATTSRKPDDNAPGELSVSWWNVKTRRSRELWRCDLKPGEFGDLWLGDWFAESNTVALRFIKGKEYRLLLLKPAIGEAKEVVLPPTDYSGPRSSPTQNYAALVDPAGSCEKEIHFFDATGKIGDAIALPGTVYFQGWSDDGAAFLGSHTTENADGTTRNQWYAVNP